MTIPAVSALLACAMAFAAPAGNHSLRQGCEQVGQHLKPRATSAGSAPAFPPVEIRTPFKPTAFPSAGRAYLMYKLHLRNFEAARALRGIEAVDAADPTGNAIARFEGDSLGALLVPVGTPPAGASDDAPHLASGHGAVRVPLPGVWQRTRSARQTSPSGVRG